MDAAISQHRIGSIFVKEFVKQHVPEKLVPCTIIPNNYNDNHVRDACDIDLTSMTITPTIEIQIEDFGGNFAMHHYGHSRPSTDYFNSNLMVSNFFVVNLINDSAKVLFYDE
jgi:hypothetical protein